MSTDQPNRDTILETIQRLLALSGSPNEHEAQLALAKAQEWMLRYNISMVEVESAEVGEKDWVEEELWSGGARPPGPTRYAAEVVQKCFFVRAVWVSRRDIYGFSKRLRIFGQKENVAIARHVFVYLCRVFRQLWDAYRRENAAAPNQAHGFYLGLALGLADKLRAEREVAEESHTSSQCNALVVCGRELDRRFREQYPRCRDGRSRDVKDTSAFGDGYDHGKAIELRKGVEGEASRRMLT